MSMRYQASIILPGYNPLKVANAPTIGTATAGSSQVSVAFTAPACTGGGAISSYTVFANCGIKATTGASSPLVVTGLTNGTAYTFKTIATNAYGPSYPSAASNSATPVEVTGQQAYTTAGTYSWVAPAGVTKVSVVAVGGGGNGAFRFLCSGYYSCGAGGGGGGLGYKNNYTVVPGNSYTVQTGGANTNSFFVSTAVVYGGGGATGSAYSSCGGVYFGDGGGTGGYGCSDGGGGGGGYSGAGGGGVGILGQGSNGAGGRGGVAPNNVGGGAGSSGTAGSNSSTATNAPGGNGGAYGGGGGGGAAVYTGSTRGLGAVGAVRIIWPGTTRSFPSTCTGNL